MRFVYGCSSPSRQRDHEPARAASGTRAPRCSSASVAGVEVGLVRERQRDAHHALDAVGREVLLAARRRQPLVELGDALAQLALGLHEAAGALDALLGEAGVELAAAAFEKAGQLRRDDRVHAAHVGAHRVELAERTQDVVAVAAARRRPGAR